MRLSEKLTEERKFLDNELISLRSQIVGMNFNTGGSVTGVGGGNSNNNSSRVMYQVNVGQHGQIPSFGGGGGAAAAAEIGGNQINKSQSSQNLGGEYGDFMPSKLIYNELCD